MSIDQHYHLGVVIKFNENMLKKEDKVLCSNNSCIHSLEQHHISEDSNFCKKCGSETKIQTFSKNETIPQLDLEDFLDKEILEENDYEYVVRKTPNSENSNLFLSTIEGTYLLFNKWSDVSFKIISPKMIEDWLEVFKKNHEVQELLKVLNEKYGENTYSINVALSSYDM